MIAKEQKHCFDPGWLTIQYHIMDMIGETRGKAILDVGCAEGFYPTVLSWMGNEATGIDNDPDKIKFAMNKHCNFLVADAQKFKLYKKYDIIICNLVLEHVPYPMDVLLRIKEHLKPNGFAIICTPSLTTIPHRILWRWIKPKLVESFKAGRSDHIHHRFKYTELKHMLEVAGFKVTQARGLEMIYLLKPKHWITAINNFLAYCPGSKFLGASTIVKAKMEGIQ